MPPTSPTDQFDATTAGGDTAATARREIPTSDAPERVGESRSDFDWLLYPEYGPIDSIVGFAIFYLLVDALTPTFVDALALVLPDVATSTLTTGTALALWLVAGITALTVVLPQVAANPRRFDSRDERDAFLDANRPSEMQYKVNLTLLVLGGATAFLAWRTVLDVFRGMLPVVVELGGEIPPVLTAGNVAIFVVFVVGVAAYARGLDRLVIGGVREFLYRTMLDDWE